MYAVYDGDLGKHGVEQIGYVAVFGGDLGKHGVGQVGYVCSIRWRPR